MMGRPQHRQDPLFYVGLCLEDRIPPNHLLRQIDAAVDWDAVRQAVAPCYGRNGQESVDPAVLLKLMLLRYLHGGLPQREVLRQLAYRLDWLWFCGYRLDASLPDHSVLTKARKRWGRAVFAQLFAQVLGQCLAAGLVGNHTVHVDGSTSQACVDMARLQPALRLQGQDLFDQLEQEDAPAAPPAPLATPPAASTPAPAAPPPVAPDAPAPAGRLAPEDSRPHSRLTAASDPQAGVTRKYGRTCCGYKDHRAIDDACGVITATVTTDAAVDEGRMLPVVLAQHLAGVGARPGTIVGDRQYGTGENCQLLQDQGITACLAGKRRPVSGVYFSLDRFIYRRREDCYVCPAGQRLGVYRRDEAQQRVRYRAAKGVCQRCPLRAQCTSSRHGRRVERHTLQDARDWARDGLPPAQRRRLLGRRKSVAEGSFAESQRLGFKHTGRGLEQAAIQNFLIATTQNLKILLRHRPRRRTAPGAAREFRPGVGPRAGLLPPPATPGVRVRGRHQPRHAAREPSRRGSGHPFRPWARRGPSRSRPAGG